MGVETLRSDTGVGISIMDDAFLQEQPLNGTDARRRLEDKMEELRLLRELKEFDFDE